MRILQIHNFYQQPGGEDSSFAAEAGVMEAHGHAVIRYTAHNDDIEHMSAVSVAAATFWNHGIYRRLRALIRSSRPDVMHCQNIFPLISPAAYYAARSERVPVVQSLRNFRLLCANAFLFRDNRPCEDCVGRTVPIPALRHRCYRDSLAATSVTAGMQVAHRLLGTWTNRIDRYIALTEFVREKFVTGGLPPGKIAVKPDFVATDPGIGAGSGGYSLFVGRLSPEKGLESLLEATRLSGYSLPLKIVGDGPLRPVVLREAAENPKVEWLGHLAADEVLRLMKEATFLVFPSRWYETFGRVAIEAFAVGTPVLAARIGAVAEVTQDGVTGLHFTPGSAEDLAAKANWLTTHPAQLSVMRTAARAEYEARYTAKANYGMLASIYEDAIAESRKAAR